MNQETAIASHVGRASRPQGAHKDIVILFLVTRLIKCMYPFVLFVYLGTLARPHFVVTFRAKHTKILLLSFLKELLNFIYMQRYIDIY